MSNPLHVHQIATRLIALHGPEARTIAANRADEMLAAGKLYERRTWRRVQEEVEQSLGRDLLGDFPGLTAGFHHDPADPLSFFTPFPEGANAATNVSDPFASDPSSALDPWPLSTKWMSS